MRSIKTSTLLFFFSMLFCYAENLLPLAKANQWSLSHPAISAPVVFSVVKDGVYGTTREVEMNFSAPWGSMSFYFNSVTDGLDLDGVSWGGSNYRFDLPSAFLRYSAPVGTTWSHPLGQVQLIADRLTITTQAGTFNSVRQYRLSSPDGMMQDWYLAPDVGFVQYAIVNVPFQLQAKTLNTYVPPTTGGMISSPCAQLGVLANPPANSDNSLSSHEQALKRTVDAGSRLIHITYNWDEIERSPGVYDLTAMQTQVQWAKKYNLQIVLTLRAIDGGNKPFPSDLAGRPLNDSTVIARYKNALAAMLATGGAQVKWVNLGNEVDLYFTAHPEEIAAFLELFRGGAALARAAQPPISAGVTFSFSTTRAFDAAFKALRPSMDHVAFTYYHFMDWQMKPLWVVSRDLAEAAEWAAGKPLLFTEIGAPSDTKLGSSEQIQSDFYSAVFSAIRTSGQKITAAHFFLLSDPNQAVVTHLQSYYQLTSNTLFTAYIGSLGMFNLQGVAKPAWNTFVNQAAGLKSTGCTTR